MLNPLQPVGTPGVSSAKPASRRVEAAQAEAQAVTQPISQAQATPVVPAAALSTDRFYFSTLSTRAKIDRFFNQQAPASLLFDFAVAPGSTTPLSTTHAALQIKHERVADALHPKRLRSDIKVEKIYYTPVVDGRILLEALKLDFLRLGNSAAADPIAPNVMLSPAGVLISRDQFKERGVTEMTRPRLAAFLEGLRQVIPDSFSRLLRIGEDGTVTLLNRWRFNPTRFWQDREQGLLRPFHMARLANGVIADVKQRLPLGTFMGSEAGFGERSLRKILREKILSEIDQIESEGFTLKVEPLAVPPVPLTVSDFAKSLIEASGSANPFEIIPPEEKEKPVTKLQGGT